MKIFFSSSSNNSKEADESFQSIVNYLTEEIELLGNEVLFDSQNLNLNQTVKLIQKADICTYESSFSCSKTGFLIAKSLDCDKPTIVFYSDNHYPDFLKNNRFEKLILQQYSFDRNNIEKAVRKAFNKANKLRDRRFNFFITPDLLNFLEQESRKMNITKSMFIRWLIDSYRKKLP